METIDALNTTLRTYLDSEQTATVNRAYYFAEQAHYGQRRRSGEPYVTHPLAVAGILAEMHMDHQSLVAAMLHDVIEDTGIEKTAIGEQFGSTVADLVDELRGLITVTEIDPSVRKAWAESLAEWPQSLADDLEAQGLPAKKVLNLVLDRAEANGYEWPVRYVVE